MLLSAILNLCSYQLLEHLRRSTALTPFWICSIQANGDRMECVGVVSSQAQHVRLGRQQSLVSGPRRLQGSGGSLG